MKKMIQVSSSILLMMSINGWSADVITDNQGVVINKADLDYVLNPAPINAQLSLFRDKEKLQKTIEELYVTKAVAAETKKEPLNAKEQADLEEVLKLFYFNIKLNRLSTENLPDFEPLAALEYKAKKAEYQEPEQVAAQHILLDTRKKYNEEEALKLAKNLIVQLKKGADFASLALKYSDDPAVKTNKGDLGYLAKGKMIPEFETAVFGIKPNEVANEPVQTKFGYHVLKNIGHKPAAPKEYLAVKDEIIAKLKNEYVQNRLNEYYAKVKTTKAMVFDPKALDSYIAERTKQLPPEAVGASLPKASESVAK